jgi:hypothetical protein
LSPNMTFSSRVYRRAAFGQLRTWEPDRCKV